MPYNYEQAIHRLHLPTIILIGNALEIVTDPKPKESKMQHDSI